MSNSNPSHRFPKGNKFSTGGAREGAGRKPDWLKGKCQKIIQDKKLIEFLGDVASGKDVCQRVNEKGEVLNTPADIKDRLKAVEMLIDRAFGKPAATVDVGEDQIFPFTIIRPGDVKIA